MLLLIGDLGRESIDFLDIVFRLEKAFNIKIPRGELFPEDLDAMKNDPNFVQDGKITPVGMAGAEKAAHALRRGFHRIRERPGSGQLLLASDRERNRELRHGQAQRGLKQCVWIWIDKFVSFTSRESATAIKAVTLAEEHLHDLYPAYPIVPHSLIEIEGMPQTAGILVGEARDFKEKVILAKIGRATFHRLTRPGDVLQFAAKIEQLSEQDKRSHQRARHSRWAARG